MSDERQYLTAEQAEAMLPDGEYVHTFRQSGLGVLIGADWSRDMILEAIRDGRPERSGEMTNHGLFLADGRGGLFIETRKS